MSKSNAYAKYGFAHILLNTMVMAFCVHNMVNTKFNNNEFKQTSDDIDKLDFLFDKMIEEGITKDISSELHGHIESSIRSITDLQKNSLSKNEYQITKKLETVYHKHLSTLEKFC